MVVPERLVPELQLAGRLNARRFDGRDVARERVGGGGDDGEGRGEDEEGRWGTGG